MIDYENKVLKVQVNNSTNINGTCNHLSREITEHKIKKTSYVNRNASHVLSKFVNIIVLKKGMAYSLISSTFDFFVGVDMVKCHALICIKEIYQSLT